MKRKSYIYFMMLSIFYCLWDVKIKETLADKAFEEIRNRG